ncbi:MAG: YihA family ribosome biogenesis GTP-binding protein [Alphaproteobacteria bacterium]|nr:MAG: YihA family ribosome biogenesis GTP-binding protein [Alphaproteobacteria bacterium]
MPTNPSKPFTAAEYKGGLTLFSAPCKFMRGVSKIEDLQQLRWPEIAFAGRSNVGKSSLLNALVRNKTMARVSNTPGRTQELNFFSLGDRLILVDMPGYGYAKVPVESRKHWDKFLPQYLIGRDQLRVVFVLVDARHGIKESDIQMMQLLDQTETPFQVIFTKGDQIKRDAIGDLMQSAADVADEFSTMQLPPMLVSSKTKTCIDDLQAHIYRMVKS